MFELAVTRGAEFLRFSRNAKAIVLPDGGTVLGPLDLSALPLTTGAYVIRRVEASASSAGMMPPVVEGDVVVLRPVPVS